MLGEHGEFDGIHVSVKAENPSKNPHILRYMGITPAFNR